MKTVLWGGFIKERYNPQAFAQCTVVRPVAMIEHEDFSVVVKNRATPPKPWHWEIYRVGRNSAIERSKTSFETATEANRAGQLALRLLLSEYPE